jgi:signal transduction histidine kinase
MICRWLLCLFILALSPGSGFPANTNGLPGDVVYSILQDHNGVLWFGTDAGLNRWQDGKITVFTTKDGLSGNTITALFEDRDYNLWVGTMGKGLNRFDHKKNTFILYSRREHGLTGDMIYAIDQDNSGTLWIGTNSGLIRLKGGRFTSYTVNNGLSNNIVRAVAHDRENNLWIGTDGGGLNLLKNGKFHLFDTKKGLSNDRIVSIHIDGKDVLWLGTVNGLNRFKDGFFTVFRRQHGLHSSRVFQVVEDRHRHLWIGSDTGISRISKSELNDFADGKIMRIRTVVYNQENETKGPVCVGGFQPSAIKARDGKLYFSTVKGVAVINPDRFNVEPETSFFKSTWFYISISIISLLAVCLLFYFLIRRVKARERELSSILESRTRDLEKRNLELQKARENVLKSREMMVAKNRQLEDQSEKLKEMDEIKSRFFANISHEFRTPLTLIMGPLEQIISKIQDKEQQRKLVLMLRNSQRLLDLINQLLELSRFDSGKVKLQAHKQNIIPFLKDIADSFHSLTTASGQDLVFLSQEESINLYFDPGKLEEVILNLLSNAVKFTPTRGKISVSVKPNHGKETGFPDGSLDIRICDTGPGIPRDQVPHIFDRFYQLDNTGGPLRKGSGIGLAIAKELVELHQGTIEVYSFEGKGTEFLIRIPSGDSHLKPDEIANPLEKPYQPGGRVAPSAVKDVHAETTAEEEVINEEDIDPLKQGKDIVLVVRCGRNKRQGRN